jgi:hypothetical protein
MFYRLPSEDDERDLVGRRDIRAYGPLRRAARLARRAIVAAKLRRLRGELICHAAMSADGSATPVADAARWPQPPLILGDKWDF